MFEIFSTLSMLGIAGSSFYFKNKQSNNDHDKIIKIADEVGLKTTEGGLRIYKKRKGENYTDYIYKIPLGISFKQVEEKKHFFMDGLNNKSMNDLNLQNLKNINWKGDVLKQLKDLINNRVQLDKQIELSYDGMLKFRVYDNGLEDRYDITKEIMGKSKSWNVPLGVTQSETIFHDFESQSGAHILLGGATDMGKSTTLNVTISSLIHNHPDDVEFTLIDLKGGLEFGSYENLKQVKNFATDIDGVEKVLKRVKDEMENTFNMLRKKRKKNVAGIKKRHFIIIDEAAELTSDGETDKEIKKQKIRCENYIKDISRRGRASGMKLIYSTQNPTAEVIGSQVKRNLITRICLPVDTSTASIVVLDEGGAERLPLLQGRAIYKRHRLRTMQSFNITDKLIMEIIKPYHKEDLHASSERKKFKETGTNSFDIQKL
ncbi:MULTISPECIES: FtsK/SpoIIIE domain-containing protein [unclassified Oceanobacillus]|uniref:FtsK/SpoIIIE domain-containing protein n=1 Tax=unclassified Oceanobacillus TaxID=2630292 RepID=UPI001BE66DBC|nr:MULTISPECIES: FtsK/SpoIIIE domain-containing protein [unclassified Oceanobacillus]MBT2599071.1 cell division protein FtsK [Oceanobacillus sp. ISL-74]MBT2651989.1 cell division protein FtsK [Oceanobacillus sp. ISL-73]